MLELRQASESFAQKVRVLWHY